MFKFDFDVDEDPEIDEILNSQNTSDIPRTTEHTFSVVKEHGKEFLYAEHKLDTLVSTIWDQLIGLYNDRDHSTTLQLETLPGSISFSPIRIPVDEGTGSVLTLSRRDLFDARFQLISESASTPLNVSAEKAQDNLQFVEAPSDLIPGLYEGGLKTWECSIDLASQMVNLLGPHIAESLQKKRILEVGALGASRWHFRMLMK